MPPPLHGVTVVDVGQIYNAPYATLLLALAGADVIKIEPPPGEPLRQRNAVKGSGADVPFYMLNSNKRGVRLDLKDPRGRSVLLDMVERADVFVENYRPGVLERLDLGYDVLADRNPSLVIASGSGYGQHGAYRDLPAMDLTIQAMSGVMSTTGFAHTPPVKAGPAIADFFGGIHLYGAIVTALYRRAATGNGSIVDVAMLDSVYPSLMSNIGPQLKAASPPGRTGNRHGGLAQCPYNVYQTLDGYLAMMSVSEGHWWSILRIMGREDLIGDPRYEGNSARVAAMSEVDELIEAWSSTLPTTEVFEQLRSEGVPCAPIRTLQEVVEDSHLRDRGLLCDVEVPGVGELPLLHTPLRFDREDRVPLRHSPDLGEHTRGVLCDWLGYSEEQVDELEADGVI